MNYILDKHGKPVPEPDIHKWALWFERTSNRIVAHTRYREILVSTVFLGIDHSFGGERLPVLWETMVFGGPKGEPQERYTSREDALEGHERWCQFVVDILAGGGHESYAGTTQ